MTQNLIIAIDGPAGSGKGTLARSLAEALDLAHMDTGALYRAVAREVLEAGDDPGNEKHALRGARALIEKMQGPPPQKPHSSAGSALPDKSLPDSSLLNLHNQNPYKKSRVEKILNEEALRKEEIGEGASKVAAVPAVRKALLDLQRDFAKNPGNAFKGAVLDGRDIGTAVCPEAGIKFFITAKPEVRAQRRLKELQSKGIRVTRDTVLKDMEERDARDACRQAAPMTPAPDAIVLDTSDLDADEALNTALEIIRQRADIA